MKRVLFGFALLFGLLTAVSGQRYGHVNFGNLLSEMPGTAAAQQKLQTFNDMQIAEGEKMVKQLEADYLRIQDSIPYLTPLKVREYEAEFQQRQQRILKYEQEIGVKLEQKRQELLGPLIERAREAIRAVAREEGYDMIFDSSLFNALLYTEESTDVLPLVKKKLGLE